MAPSALPGARERVRASATKPSTGISSARAVGAMPAAASSASGSTPSDFRLWRSILRRWPKAASVTRCSARRSQGSGVARGARARTSDEVTLGGGTKAEAAMSNRMRASRAPAGEHREPAVGLGAGRRGDALGDLALEHQHQPVVPGRPWLDGEPAVPAARSRYCRAGWRRCAPARRRATARGSNASASPAITSRRPG